MFLTWCLTALIFGVAASLFFAGFLAALDHWCHRRHQPEHASYQPPDVTATDDAVPELPS